MAAKQAVREQALPFKPDMNAGIYGLQAYKSAMQNTKYNEKVKLLFYLMMNGKMKLNGIVCSNK